MNLIVDAGNTQIKWAVYSENEQTEKGFVENWADFPFNEIEKTHQGISASIFSSVRDIPEQVSYEISRYFKDTIFLSLDTNLPIKLKYKTKSTLGKDRIAAAVGGAAMFPGNAVLIIDLGTAITFDLINDQSEFVGGNISPGMSLRFKSLGHFTNGLPLVTPAETINNPGQSTQEAIQAGVQLGIIYEIDAYINTLINKYNGLRVILTGGDSSFFVKNLKNTIFVVPDLVLNGLNLILEYQKGHIQS
jgi:type III pantothenate kinase